MPNKEFFYQPLYPLSEDKTEYYQLTDKYVSVESFAGKDILKIEPEALTVLAQQAIHDSQFFLRTAHQNKLPPSCLILKRVKMTNTWLYNSYVTLKSQRKVFCQTAKILAQRRLLLKRPTGLD